MSQVDSTSSNEALAIAIDAVLPQTQCRECGYAACKPYADAISAGLDTPDKCQPGGERVLQKITDILSLDPSPYLQTVIENYRQPSTFQIIADQCIGCTKCIRACPVDAIVGAPKYLHVIMADRCTGCGLCVAPCPVDCVVENYTVEVKDHVAQSATWRQQYLDRQDRLVRREKQKKSRYHVVKEELLGV